MVTVAPPVGAKKPLFSCSDICSVGLRTCHRDRVSRFWWHGSTTIRCRRIPSGARHSVAVLQQYGYPLRARPTFAACPSPPSPRPSLVEEHIYHGEHYYSRPRLVATVHRLPSRVCFPSVRIVYKACAMYPPNALHPCFPHLNTYSRRPCTPCPAAASPASCRS